MSWGFKISSDTIRLSDGSTTKRTDVCFTPNNNSILDIESFNKPTYLRRALIAQKDIIVAINGGFFFFTDESNEYPKDYNYDLCIRNHHVVGLPSSDRPILFKIGQEIFARDLISQGTLMVGQTTIEWIGAKSRLFGQRELKNKSVLYNSACCAISHCRSELTGTKRVLNGELNSTPRSSQATDLIVNQSSDGSLMITEVRKGGGSNLFSGLFILQIVDLNLNNVCGEKVHNIVLSNVSLRNVQSAITIGPSVYDFTLGNNHQINNDLSLGSVPPLKNERMARSVIYKDKDGKFHLVVFGGDPKTSNFKGVTPKEVCHLIPQSKTDWAFFLDSGQSSRLIARNPDSSEFNIYGNLHYKRWSGKQNIPHLWNYQNGRKICSAVCIKKL